MDLKELFNADTIVKIRFRDAVIENHLRTPTNEEDFEYRRRVAKFNFRQRHVETSDAALQAPLWLYDKICERVVVQNGTGEAQELNAEEKKQIPARIKLEVINVFLQEVERDEGDILKN